ncbi:hypothetical protein M3647_21145 [Paenibacillus cellulositrophicus]|uniref:hypothetical protein n=1 Tax=Paenibacillus cellulositrophicus TaxID=562959 RepID=UPI002040D98E|nr:hypothetical protein [Paenibacillus cellulositrophicus]MCM2999985.1 hypothetical protein [Paenibacillus cellulositrophicus]
MSEHARNIEIYGKSVDDFDVSPFESVEMLHRRSNLDRVFDELNQDERMKLLKHDLQLIKNAKKKRSILPKCMIFHRLMSRLINGGGISIKLQAENSVFD